MGYLIGMDEAGYGPNLGPLVVTATIWEVPGHPRDADLWECFGDAVTATPERGDSRLHVADSKQVYNPARGIGGLERGVLAALRLMGRSPAGFRELLAAVGADAFCPLHAEPWFDGCDLSLPHVCADEPLDELAERWNACCRAHGIRLLAIRSDVVLTRRFNGLLESDGGKGLALSRISLRLLRQVWNPEVTEPTWIVADKHGGRNRYEHLLHEVLDGQMLFCVGESAEQSRYRVGNTELRFQPGAEAHLPVALASMTCKYIRELAMVLFNDYWSRHVEGLAPTKGYPTDAARFRSEIAAAQARLGIDDAVLWREK